jgi:hypothetical protein
MTVSFIGAQGAAATTVTIPAHQSEDLILIFAYRDGSNTAPSTPTAGGTVPTWNLIGSSGGNTNSSNFRWAVATGSTTTSGTWTSATELICLVYRGASVGASIGGSGNATTTVNYPALTLQRTNNSSWVVGVAGHRTANNVDVAPSGMTNRASAGTEAAGHDTNATVTSWASTNVTVNASSAYRSWVVELRDPSWTETPIVGAFTLTGSPADLVKAGAPKVMTGDRGAFTLTGQPADLRHIVRIDGGTGAFTLAGQPADARHNVRIDGGRGAFTFTGNAATLAKAGAAKAITADRGAFTLTGNVADLRQIWAITADRGAFTLTGNQAGLADTDRIEAGTGAFTLTGNNATLAKVVADQLLGGTGAFTLTGRQATLARSRLFPADRGIFTFAGQPATLRQDWRTTGDRGQFLLTGNPAALTVASSLLGGRGAFAFTGNPAGLADTDKLDATTGAFILTGLSASLSKSGSRRRVVLFF